MTRLCFSDGFHRADTSIGIGNLDSGQTWVQQLTAPYDGNGNPVTAIPSELCIKSNTCVTASDGVNNPDHYVDIYTVDFGVADTTISCIASPPAKSGQGVGLVYRWSSATNFWFAVMYRDIVFDDTFLIVRKQTGGGASFTTVVSYDMTAGGVFVGTTPKLSVVLSGTRQDFFINDVNISQGFNDAFNDTATNMGICTYFAGQLAPIFRFGTPCGGPRIGKLYIP